jgi:Flp pilus assembly pilin Flp
MRGVARSFLRQDEGQDLIEYSLLCALLGVACIAGILNLTRIIEFFERAGLALRNAI